MVKNIVTMILIVPLILLQLALPAIAAQARLTDIVVNNTGEYLHVNLMVTDCFTEEMIEAIENGIETTFTFIVKIYEKRDIWPDKNIESLKVSHTIRYDILKKHYELNLSEKDSNTIVIKDFKKAKEVLSSLDELKVTSVENLQTGKHYRLMMMAELDKITLPLYLHKFLFFLSLWDFETDLYIYDFKY